MGLGLWKPLNVSWGLGSGAYYPKNHDRNSITSFCPVKFHSSQKDPSVSAFFPAPSSFPPVLRERVKSIILRVLECRGVLLNAKQLYQVAHCSTVSQVLMDGGKEKRRVTGCIFKVWLWKNISPLINNENWPLPCHVNRKFNLRAVNLICLPNTSAINKKEERIHSLVWSKTFKKPRFTWLLHEEMVANRDVMFLKEIISWVTIHAQELKPLSSGSKPQHTVSPSVGVR